MGFGFGQELRLNQSLRLSHAQKLELKQLQMQLSKLQHSEFPDAERGLQGMLRAHEMLAANNAYGLLVGGLGRDVWLTTGSETDLEKHKDVDVVILSPHYRPVQFEGGIDWWNQHRTKVTYHSGESTIQVTPVYLKNGFDFALAYGPNAAHILQNTGGLHGCYFHLRNKEPGLYIPDPEFYIETKTHEALMLAEKVQVDPEAVDKFRKSLFGTRKHDELMPAVAKRFGDRVVGDNMYYVSLFEMGLYARINSICGK